MDSPDQVFYRDSAISDIGLRITTTGTISYILEKRIQGRVKRITPALHQIDFEVSMRKMIFV